MTNQNKTRTSISLNVIHGDCLDELRKLPAESVHCCITSPPYWGLRDYGIPPAHWPDGQVCCFGLEKTPEDYVAHSVLIFREVWRVLRKDGTLWVNLGDSFASKWPCNRQNKIGEGSLPNGKREARPARIGNLKDGDLVGIPWLVAFALQRDGWWLRRDNIWHKPNPMPESVNGWRWERCRVKISGGRVERHGREGVTEAHGASISDRDGAFYIDCTGCKKCDKNGGLVLRRGAWRCTTSHEYFFQFSKSADYFCDAEAAKQKSDVQLTSTGASFKRKNSKRGIPQGSANNGTHRPDRADVAYVGSRNPRSVWKVPTKGFKGAHFATYPPALIAPIIKAATPPTCCSACGAPWAPVVERGEPDLAHQRACGGDQKGEYHGEATKDFLSAGAQNASAVKARILAGMVAKRVKEYRPTCRCNAGGAPAVVLDPFGGSGTTGEVALGLGRAATLIEIAPHYLPLIAKRTGTSEEHLKLH